MQLPPLQATRAVIQRYARLLHRYGEDLGTRPLVLPNGSFFPDAFLGDDKSVATLAARMQLHAGMADIPIQCRVVIPGSAEATPSSCGSGACGVPLSSASGIERLVDQGESWLIQVPAPELRHPVALTTNLARSLAFVFMVETQKEGERLEPPVDVSADLIAVALGFGPLMLQGSYIYAKSCGGPQIASVTKIGVSELAVAVALFAHLGGHKMGPVLKELEVTQRTLLADAHRLMTLNRALLSRIHVAPESIARTEFELEETGSFIRQLFTKFSKRPAGIDSLDGIDANMDLDEVEALLIDMPPSSRAGRTVPLRADALPSRSDAVRPQSSAVPDDLKNMVEEALKEARA